jgi:hypothetical protein
MHQASNKNEINANYETEYDNYLASNKFTFIG